MSLDLYVYIDLLYIIRLNAAPDHSADRSAVIRSRSRNDPDPRIQLNEDPAHCGSGLSSQNRGDPQMSHSVPKIPSKIMILDASGSYQRLVCMCQITEVYPQSFQRYEAANYVLYQFNHRGV